MNASERLVLSLLNWFGSAARDLPWRRTADPYAVWVSEIMLQQTQVNTVIPYFQRWMEQLPTIASLAKASSTKIHKLWEGLGYYTRVRNLQTAAQVIMREHGGIFPEEFEAVLALPGIGRYTAGAICSIAFNQPTAILDGNVMRVLARLYGVEGEPREKKTNARLWGLAENLVSTSAAVSLFSSGGEIPPDFVRALRPVTAKDAFVGFQRVARTVTGQGLRERRPIDRRLPVRDQNRIARRWPPPPGPLLQRGRGRNLTPDSPGVMVDGSAICERGTVSVGKNRLLTSAATGNCSRFNQALMELGALICTPRNPRCEVCPVNHCCVALRKNRVEQLPALSRRPRVTVRRFMAFVLEHEGRFLVRQRAGNVVNAHLWEFPNVEVGPNGVDVKSAARAALKIQPGSLEPLCVIKHSITRYRITLEAFRSINRSRRREEAEVRRIPRGATRLASASLPPPSAVPNRRPESFNVGCSEYPRPAEMLRRTGRRLQEKWFTRRQLLNLPFSSAHKKILQRLPGPG